MTPSDVLNGLIKTVGDHLRPLGFARQGANIRIIQQDTCGLLQFQRSMSSTKDRLLFTVNVGVVCGRLLATGVAGLRKSLVHDAHVRARIGEFLPGRPDKWWEISELTDADALTQEVLKLVLDHAVPWIQRYPSTSAIIALWESGQSPGLTDRERVDLLAFLKART